MDETLGQRIKRLRQLRGWTQEQLADMVGTSMKSVGNWEKDRNHPRSALPSLEGIFKQSLEDGAPTELDPVLAALDASGLLEWRRNAVRAEYLRHVHEQSQAEATG